MEKVNLDYDNFEISKTTIISNEDRENLRLFYGPFLGAEAVYLYEYLLDLVKESNWRKVEFPFSLLSLYLNINIDSLNVARKKLEAVGLINLYNDNSKAISIFDLQKPLDYNGIINNEYISNLIKDNIGLSNLNYLISTKKHKISVIDDSNYEDITTNFFDMFNPNETSSKNNIKQHYTNVGKKEYTENELRVMTKNQHIKIPLQAGSVIYTNTYDAIINLKPDEFYSQINKISLSMVDNDLISFWASKVTDYKVLNLAMFIGRKARKTDSWTKYVNTLIKELETQNINDYYEAEEYLIGKMFNNSKLRPIYDEFIVLKNNIQGRNE
ncbi:hypothetical protein KQ876_02135 [Mycoplasma sp. CSL7491-lung]|uniref:hypothetical protein n=1 Tax=Mycoplasma sp. CSL7491-lung TaxID=549718 RepID=UPI001C0FBF7B|nr:hypothetical protein [Mycoplasma sp. CSL7491-lung]MBU4693004.1 hypothetical protein [Mycoplasma sp. CSL7491-lung]